MMSREQVDELLAIGRARITDWKQRLSLTPVDANTEVQGTQVTLHGIPQVIEPAELTAQTYTMIIFSRLRRTLNGDTEDWSPWSEWVTVNRLTGAVTGGSRGQMFNIPSSEDEPGLLRTFELELMSRGVEDWQRVQAGLDVEALIALAAWKYPLTLNVREFTESVPSQPRRSFALRLPTSAAERFQFEPATENEYTTLFPVSVTR